jgi:hypothetical protein
MNTVSILTDFIDEVLGLHSAYALGDIDYLTRAGDAAALLRLRVRMCDALRAEGWNSSEEGAVRLDRDRRLLLEADDDDLLPVEHSQEEERATIRARASRVRHESGLSRAEAGSRRLSSRDLREELAEMRQAIDSRSVLEQAKGIAMERYGMPAEAAWALLVRTSQQRDEKLRLIAEELVDSVHPPERRPADHSTTTDGADRASDHAGGSRYSGR